jgi:hypothetical protein
MIYGLCDSSNFSHSFGTMSSDMFMRLLLLVMTMRYDHAGHTLFPVYAFRF